MCDDLARSKHLIVIDQNVVDSVDIPVTGKDGVKSFKGGEVEGTLLVFDLESGAYLGARPYHAKSSETVGYTVQLDENGKEKPNIADVHAVGLDLDRQTAASIDAALAGA